MTDREMLELAAKAGGLDVWIDENGTPWIDGDKKIWNPLADDGDALRLAVKIGFDFGVCFQVIIDGEMSWTGVRHTDRGGKYDILQNHDSYPYAATRLAITRAAAEIGKAMHKEVNSALPEDNYYKDMADAFYGCE